MTDASDFLSILDCPLSEISKPEPLPANSFFQFKIVKYGLSKIETKNGEMKKLVLSCKPIACVDDRFSADDLPEGWKDDILYKDFVIDTKQRHRIKEFLEGTLGFAVTDNAAEIIQTCLVGQEFIGEVTHRLFQNKAGEDEIAVQIGSTSKVE